MNFFNESCYNVKKKNFFTITVILVRGILGKITVQQAVRSDWQANESKWIYQQLIHVNTYSKIYISNMFASDQHVLLMTGSVAGSRFNEHLKKFIKGWVACNKKRSCRLKELYPQEDSEGSKVIDWNCRCKGSISLCDDLWLVAESRQRPHCRKKEGWCLWLRTEDSQKVNTQQKSVMNLPSIYRKSMSNTITGICSQYVC